MHSGRTSDKKETPLFYTLSKLKSQADKVAMVSAFIDADQVDFEVQNKDSLTCTEAYQEEHGFDEAASLIDNIHL
jgi:hypothetical protein